MYWKKGMSHIECSIESVFGNMKYISKLLNHKNDFNVTVGILKFLLSFLCLLLRRPNVYLSRAGLSPVLAWLPHWGATWPINLHAVGMDLWAPFSFRNSLVNMLQLKNSKLSSNSTSGRKLEFLVIRLITNMIHLRYSMIKGLTIKIV